MLDTDSLDIIRFIAEIVLMPVPWAEQQTHILSISFTSPNNIHVFCVFTITNWGRCSRCSRCSRCRLARRWCSWSWTGLPPVGLLLRQRSLGQLWRPREYPPPILTLEVPDPCHRPVVLPDRVVQHDPRPLAWSELRAPDELHVAGLVAIDPDLLSDLEVCAPLLGRGGHGAWGLLRGDWLWSTCNHKKDSHKYKSLRRQFSAVVTVSYQRMETSSLAPRMDGLFYWAVWARWLCLMYSWLLVCPWVGGNWPKQGGGLGLPHHPTKSQCDGRELENKENVAWITQNIKQLPFDLWEDDGDAGLKRIKC